MAESGGEEASNEKSNGIPAVEDTTTKQAAPPTDGVDASSPSEDVNRTEEGAVAKTDSEELQAKPDKVNSADSLVVKGPVKETETSQLDEELAGLTESLESSAAPSEAKVPSSAEKKLALAERRVSVTVDRKNVLLLRARESRNEWVAQVPMPYRESADKDDPWQQDERLKTLQSVHAAKKLPTTMSVLSHLYNIDDSESYISDVADRIHNLLGSAIEHDGRAIPSTTDRIKAELASNDKDTYLMDYHKFWKQLQDPSCAMLVQGMRNFVRKLRNLIEKDELSTTLNSYVRSTFQSLQSHAMWKKDGADERLRRSLEAFVFGQAHDHLESTLWSTEAKECDQALAQRLKDLQFITPQNLEIDCLLHEGLDIDALLGEAVAALQSVDLYFSVYDKLQRVLAVYHGVNTALSKALNNGQEEGATKKLPSADDVLPTIILTVIRARPDRLHFNLGFIEDFSTPEYLRGEAGYSFTNLYGAVQFLQDLDLDEPKSLSISPEEFHRKLDACRTQSETKLRSSLSKKAASPTNTPDPMDGREASIPPVEVRKARQRGERVDLDWAMQWQEQNANEESASSAGRRAERANTEDFEERLPSGFSRSYTFLNTRPEDIKISDLPKLLSEYRMLVHTTETLIGERAAKAAAERKSSRKSIQRELYARVRQVDPSLLPLENGTKNP